MLEKHSCNQVFLCPTAHSGIDDLYDVRDELTPVATKWKSFGCALQLGTNVLESIQNKNRDDPGFLTLVVKEWLKRNYNVEKFGVPTWQRLVKALSDITGGANMALASDIAKKHKATSISNLLQGIFFS